MVEAGWVGSPQVGSPQLGSSTYLAVGRPQFNVSVVGKDGAELHPNLRINSIKMGRQIDQHVSHLQEIDISYSVQTKIPVFSMCHQLY